MNAWQVLGISPTTDQRTIKRAYAKQLKLIDQEQDPDAFLQLREAFEHAQLEAKYSDHHDAEHSFYDDEDLQFHQHQDVFAPKVDDSPTQHKNTSPSTVLDQHIEQLEQQLKQQFAQTAIQNSLIQLKPLLHALDAETAHPYFEKISYLLYIHDLESLFDIITPTVTSKVDLYHIPHFEDAANSAPELHTTTFDRNDQQAHENFSSKPRHEEFELYNIPLIEDPAQHILNAIEQAYQSLTYRLEHHINHLSIHDVLFAMSKKLLELDAKQQAHYYQKFYTLLAQYQQEKWIFYLRKPTSSDLEH